MIQRQLDHSHFLSCGLNRMITARYQQGPPMNCSTSVLDTTQKLHICQHPIVQHQLSIIRNEQTPNAAFRQAIKLIGQFVFQQASQWLPTQAITVNTPICPTQCQQLDARYPLLISPILRAGLVLADVALEVIPTASIYHIGLYRDEDTLQPVSYYNKLPENLDYRNARVFIVDPMLATGGSAIAAVTVFNQLGVPLNQITFVCVIAAPEGVSALHQAFPDIEIHTAALDEKLNEKGYIVPGLGDAGDRAFGTLK